MPQRQGRIYQRLKQTIYYFYNIVYILTIYHFTDFTDLQGRVQLHRRFIPYHTNKTT
jgi:hypothetical protein